jgi:hypothetical protein
MLHNVQCNFKKQSFPNHRATHFNENDGAQSHGDYVALVFALSSSFFATFFQPLEESVPLWDVQDCPVF